MAKGTLDWNSAETWQRVVASLLATGYKPDLRQAAAYFGTTYDTFENRFRKIKKDAEGMKAAADKGETAPATPARTKSTPSTPRKQTPKKDALETVATGRVSKQTPRKKTIKKEDTGEENGTPSDNQPDITPTDSVFDFDGAAAVFNAGDGYDFN